MEEENEEFPDKLSGEALIEKNQKIKKETNRLKKLFKEIPENRKKLVQRTIENAAFMSVTLEDLMKHIKIYGVKEEYMNGNNQFGFKESIESKTYNNMIKNYCMRWKSKAYHVLSCGKYRLMVLLLYAQKVYFWKKRFWTLDIACRTRHSRPSFTHAGYAGIVV